MRVTFLLLMIALSAGFPGSGKVLAEEALLTAPPANSTLTVSCEGNKTAFDEIYFDAEYYGPTATLVYVLGISESDTLYLFGLLQNLEDSPIQLTDSRLGIISISRSGNYAAHNDTTSNLIAGSFTFTQLDTAEVISGYFSDNASLLGIKFPEKQIVKVGIAGKFSAQRDPNLADRVKHLNRKKSENTEEEEEYEEEPEE